MLNRRFARTVLMATCVGAIAFALFAYSRRTPIVVAQLSNPGNCTQPCWHGIQPGQTTMAEARKILDADRGLEMLPNSGSIPQWRSTQTSGWIVSVSGENLVDYLDLEGRFMATSDLVLPDVHLGDLVQAFGQPVGYRLSMMTDTAEGIVYFRDSIQANVGTVYIAMGGPVTEMRPFVPEMGIRYLRYVSPSIRQCRPYPWPGFTAASPTAWQCQR